jgi:hypothetical protein
MSVCLSKSVCAGNVRCICRIGTKKNKERMWNLDVQLEGCDNKGNRWLRSSEQNNTRNDTVNFSRTSLFAADITEPTMNRKNKNNTVHVFDSSDDTL